MTVQLMLVLDISQASWPTLVGLPTSSRSPFKSWPNLVHDHTKLHMPNVVLALKLGSGMSNFGSGFGLG